jgi:hypothetical protein
MVEHILNFFKALFFVIYNHDTYMENNIHVFSELHVELLFKKKTFDFERQTSFGNINFAN